MLFCLQFHLLNFWPFYIILTIFFNLSFRPSCSVLELVSFPFHLLPSSLFFRFHISSSLPAFWNQYSLYILLSSLSTIYLTICFLQFLLSVKILHDIGKYYNAHLWYILLFIVFWFYLNLNLLMLICRYIESFVYILTLVLTKFYSLSSFATNSTSFLMLPKGYLNKQTSGTAMGSLPKLVVAHILMESFETLSLESFHY